MTAITVIKQILVNKIYMLVTMLCNCQNSGHYPSLSSTETLRSEIWSCLRFQVVPIQLQQIHRASPNFR